MIRKLATLALLFAPLSFLSAHTSLFARPFECYRRQAIRMNKLAGNLRTPEDARMLVGLFANNFQWSGRLAGHAFLDHLAEAEFNAAHDPARGIPEQQVASAWNTYLDEIGAPPETRVTAAEIHSLRDGQYVTSRVFWRPRMENIFAMPALYNTLPDESLAPNCRPLEALLSLWSIDNSYDNLTAARQRLEKGVLLSSELRKYKVSPAHAPRRVGVVNFRVIPPNPVTVAARLYAQQHGEQQLRAANERLAENLLAGH